MFSTIFSTTIRVIVVPILAILLLQRLVEVQSAVLIVNVVFTILIFPMILWHGMKLIPNLALLRKKQFLHNLVELIMEVGAVIGFWIFYLSMTG